MKYEVCVEAPRTPSLKASGRWVVEADSRDEALALVMTNAQAKWWPQGSIWNIRAGDSAVPAACGSAAADRGQAVTGSRSRGALVATGLP